MEVLGGGGFGLVVRRNNALKLYYDVNDCKSLENEAQIQIEAYEILKPVGIRVPKVIQYYKNLVEINGIDYLCGLEMELIKPYSLPGHLNGHQFHLPLNSSTPDVDTLWEVTNKLGVYRGFYPSIETIEEVLDEFDMTIDGVAELMGRGLCTLLDNEIIPVDVEWVLDFEGKVWMIDFGLCRRGKREPMKIYNGKGVEGLVNDLYVPHKCRKDKGYEAFIKGFKI